MKFGRSAPHGPQLLWLFGLLAVFGLASGGAGGAPTDLPPGLSEVSPPVAMPTFRLPTLQGTTMEAADLEGKVVVVRFWATW